MSSDQEEVSHTIVAGEGIHRVEEKSFPWTGETHHGKSSIDEKGKNSVDRAVRPIVKALSGISSRSSLNVHWKAESWVT